MPESLMVSILEFRMFTTGYTSISHIVQCMHIRLRYLAQAQAELRGKSAAGPALAIPPRCQFVTKRQE